ncbi:MAG TPA: glycerol-3-phosphate dehydrogenase [Roseiarcus sp.]|nr:glycerol-3-phosphate dehydrogenase [Roseiarcus sp.]
MDGLYDLAIIGGGINGCGIARDAAGRGLKVYLCEKEDLASGTSSASTKLIHGGLRYLEYFEFRLVREALMEREILWRIAPHVIWPLRFVLPHHKGLRPPWMLRLGLFLYDHLGGRRLLPPARRLDLTRDPAGRPLRPGFRRGFEYSDCWADDARLVVLNARDAANRGAMIRTRAEAIAAERGPDAWRLTTQRRPTGEIETIKARILINAAGPWVGEVFALARPGHSRASVRLVQGSHIVAPRLYEHDRCYIFQNADNRIIFAIPYERDFTLIGTTDRDYVGDPARVRASAEEIEYLCRSASEYFASPIKAADVVWTYSGVRPLYDDGASAAQAATRDYVLELDETGGAPILSIFGGKITTYRRLAQHALEKLAAHIGADALAKRDWSGAAPLPGGDFPVQGFETLVAALAGDYPWLDASQIRRLARAYGTKAREILGNALSPAALGRDFGAGLTEAETLYLMREEWAEEAADIIWRRSKLGLRLSPDQVAELDLFMAGHCGKGAGAAAPNLLSKSSSP